MSSSLRRSTLALALATAPAYLIVIEQERRKLAASGLDVEVPHGAELQAAGQCDDVVHASHAGSRTGRDA